MRAFVIASTLAAAVQAAAATLSYVAEIDRPEKPEALSSLSFVSNGVYLSATDWHPALYELSVVAADNGRSPDLSIARKCDLEGAKDVEGVAWDPLRGTVWIADEVNAVVSEHDPTTGRRLGKLETPEVFRKFRRTFGLESLCISPNGLEMWLANEEALSCDGPRSAPKGGTRVRLARFSRRNGEDAWRADGQFAYVTESMSGSALAKGCRLGLVGLCVLESGVLLALEREFSFSLFPRICTRVFSVKVDGATDVSSIAALEGAEFVPAAKSLLYAANTGFAMYEGIAAAPVEADGSRPVDRGSDGDHAMLMKLRVLRLSP